MSNRETLKDSRSAISLQESADGPMPSVSPDGQATDPSGQAPVPVSRFRALPGGELPEKTSGLNGQELSWHQSHLPFSGNKSLGVLGLIGCAMSWKKWATPSGRKFDRLSVSVKTISDIGFTLLATPTATANQNCRSMKKHPGCQGIEVSPEAWRKRMGFPPEWDDCAPTGTLSSRKSRLNS